MSQLSPIEASQLQRVFWIAYCFDKDFSLRFEQPPIINDIDMDVDLPDTMSDSELSLTSTVLASNVNYFHLRIDLALIQSKAYVELYSVPALKLSETQKLPAVQRLDRLLQDWKNNLPIELHPDNLTTTVIPFPIIYIVSLHLLYFNCLTTVHRVSFQDHMWAKAIIRDNPEIIKPEHHQICHSALRCIEAARASMRLMKLVPQGDFAGTWYVELLILLYVERLLTTCF
jgi:hypothetical protein